MNVNVQGIRRNVKNVVLNYTDAQVKVREATSNDPWGPPSALMGEIADLSYNVVAFTEIMQIIWKRLNDNGKNWRHVYKALVLLEYLIKVGSERVASQCKENIFAIQTLKDFQYVEDNKDQGMNVREKSKQLVALLKDDERLRQERLRALKAKERFAQNTNMPSASHDTLAGMSYAEDLSSPRSNDYRSVLAPSNSELESARPQTAGEEELQLQLALAMSKEEAEQEERQRKHDDLRLQMALTESQQDTIKQQKQQSTASANSFSLSNGVSGPSSAGPSKAGGAKSCLDDLLGLKLGGPTLAPPGAQASSTDPWGLPPSVSTTNQHTAAASATAADPWAPTVDPWAPQTSNSAPVVVSDPWAPNGAVAGAVGGVVAAVTSLPAAGRNDLDEFDLISRQRAANISPITASSATHIVNGRGSASQSPAFDLSGMGGALPKTSATVGGSSSENSTRNMRKTPESFLGPNSNLVNLDALVTAKPTPPPPANPFGGGLSGLSVSGGILNPGPSHQQTPPPPQNPFQALNKPLTINELRGGPPMNASFDGFASAGVARATPTPGSVNPFL